MNERRSSQLLTHHDGFTTNHFDNLLLVGFSAQLVEHCTGITEVKGSNPEQC